jgi:hypothetical protein
MGPGKASVPAPFAPPAPLKSPTVAAGRAAAFLDAGIEFGAGVGARVGAGVEQGTGAGVGARVCAGVGLDTAEAFGGVVEAAAHGTTPKSATAMARRSTARDRAMVLASTGRGGSRGLPLVQLGQLSRCLVQKSLRIMVVIFVCY